MSVCKDCGKQMKHGNLCMKCREKRSKKRKGGDKMKSKLATVRKSKGLSQSELAKVSGVPIKSIQFFEQNPDKIDGTKLNTLCSLSLALNCSIEDIIEGEELKAKYRKIKGVND